MSTEKNNASANAHGRGLAIELVDHTAHPRTPAEPPMDYADIVASLGNRLSQLAEELPERELDALHRILASSASHDPVRALAGRPASDLLTPAEAEAFDRLRAEPPAISAGLRPSMVMIMKATRLCNLRCTYCYQWRDGPNQVMGFEVMARAIRDVLRAPDVERVEFVWHGGEATLLSIDTYRKALWLQQQFRRPGQRIDNSMQTNAVRMSDEWIRFWKDHGFSIGISLDGPPAINDARRVDVAGRATSARIVSNLQRLRAAGVAYGVLMVVDEDVLALGARALLDYLLAIGVREVDLLNALPDNQPADSRRGTAYLPLPRYVAFLREMFSAWWPAHAKDIAIRELSGLVSQLQGGPAHTCVFAGNCFGGFLTVEPNGAVSACDKYDGDGAFRFGTLAESTLSEIGQSARLLEVRRENAESVDLTRSCRWHGLCRGGCPHDRHTSKRQAGNATDEGCCGMAPIFEHIAGTLSAEGRTLHPLAGSWARQALPQEPVTAESAAAPSRGDSEP